MLEDDDISKIVEKEANKLIEKAVEKSNEEKEEHIRRLKSNINRYGLAAILISALGLFSIYTNVYNSIDNKIEHSIDNKKREFVKVIEEKKESIDSLAVKSVYKAMKKHDEEQREEIKNYVDKRVSEESKKNYNKTIEVIDNAMNDGLSYVSNEINKIRRDQEKITNYLARERSLRDIGHIKHHLNPMLHYHVQKAWDGLIVTIPKNGSVSQACMDYTGSFFTWKDFIGDYRNRADNWKIIQHPDFVKPGDKLFIPKRYLLRSVIKKYF